MIQIVVVPAEVCKDSDALDGILNPKTPNHIKSSHLKRYVNLFRR